MGNINISDLRPAGADLFLDSESYLNDLTEGEMISIIGASPWSGWFCRAIWNLNSYTSGCPTFLRL